MEKVSNHAHTSSLASLFIFFFTSQVIVLVSMVTGNVSVTMVTSVIVRVAPARRVSLGGMSLS